ncbi:MAG: hypothetical protein J0H26_13455, partial [Alphaproteobacteria bacterium]|nr:hypothetical protein [Alphaproteobacteria bacterium]
MRFFIDSFLGIRKSPGDGRPNAGKRREIQVKSASPTAPTQALRRPPKERQQTITEARSGRRLLSADVT